MSRRLEQKKQCRKGGPKALQKGLLFRPEICKNAFLWDLEPSWGLDGGPDSQNHQNDLPNYQKSTYVWSKFRQSAHSCSYYKIQNKNVGSVPPCISMFLGTIFAGRVPSLQVSRFVAFRSNDFKAWVGGIAKRKQLVVLQQKSKIKHWGKKRVFSPNSRSTAPVRRLFMFLVICKSRHEPIGVRGFLRVWERFFKTLGRRERTKEETHM